MSPNVLENVTIEIFKHILSINPLINQLDISKTLFSIFNCSQNDGIVMHYDKLKHYKLFINY